MALRHTVNGWTLSAAYFIVVGLLFAAVAAVSVQPHSTHIVAHSSQTITVADSFSAARSGPLGDAGIVLLILVGPAAGLLRGAVLLCTATAFLFVTGATLLRHNCAGAVAGAAWCLVMLALSAIAFTRLSFEYSVAAKGFLFAPAVAVNGVLIISLSRRIRRSSVSEAI